MISRFLLSLFFLVGLTSHFASAQVLDRVQRGGGQVIITDNGSVRIAPKLGAAIIQINSCASAPLSASNTANWCYDATTGAMRISANGGPYVNWSNPGAGPGTVSSVGLALPSSIFLVSGSPVTTSGTLTATLQGQTANYVFASPDGSSGAPLFRALVAADIPALNASKITAGILTAPRGGTGIGSYSQGAMLYANTSSTLAQVTPYLGPARRFLMATGDGTTPDPPAFSQPAFSDLSGTAAISQGGTGQTALGTANYLLGVNAAGNATQYWNLVAGSNVAINRAGANITISATGTLSGDFRATDGTSSAPSYSFTNETGLGFYRQGSGSLGVMAPALTQEASTRPTYGFLTTGTAARGRLFAAVPNWFGFTSNLNYSGTAWNLDDTTKGGGIVNVDSSGASASINFSLATAGANPRTPSTPVTINAAGVKLNNSGGAVTFADNSFVDKAIKSETEFKFFEIHSGYALPQNGPTYNNVAPVNSAVNYHLYFVPSEYAGTTFALEASYACPATIAGQIRVLNVTDSSELINLGLNAGTNRMGRFGNFSLGSSTSVKRLVVQGYTNTSGTGNCTIWNVKLVANPKFTDCGAHGFPDCTP